MTDHAITAPMSADELEASIAMEQWEVGDPKPPNVFQVVETGDARLIGAFILRGIRQGARSAVQGHRRVIGLREFTYLACEGAEAAENFLRRPDHSGGAPLHAALASREGRDAAIR